MALRVRAAFFSLIRDEVRAFLLRWPTFSDRAEACVVVGFIREFWLSDWSLLLMVALWGLLAADLSIRTSGMYLLLWSVLEEIKSTCGWLFIAYELEMSSLSLRFFHQAAVRWVKLGQIGLCSFLSCCCWSVCGLTSSLLRELLWQDLWKTEINDNLRMLHILHCIILTVLFNVIH